MDELLSKLSNDGPSLRTRRSLGVFQVIGKDLVPLLVAASNEYPKVVPKLIKLLSHLTSPIEILLPANFITTEEGKQVAYELDSLLRAIKLVFTDFRATKPVVDYLKVLTSKVKPTFLILLLLQLVKPALKKNSCKTHSRLNSCFKCTLSLIGISSAIISTIL